MVNSMLKAHVTLDKDFAVGEVDVRLFGGFAKHIGRYVYVSDRWPSDIY